MIFRDRVDAGEKLAKLVAKEVNGRGVVLGIPRGGMVLAKIVAEKLNWPLDILKAKKVTLPENPELAVGAEVKPPFPVLDKIDQVIVVDDGAATGQTLEAAIKYLRARPLKVVAAVPVAARDSARRLKPLVDNWICLFEPEDLSAVGQYYEEFGQVSDEEVVKLLHEANRRFRQSGGEV